MFPMRKLRKSTQCATKYGVKMFKGKTASLNLLVNFELYKKQQYRQLELKWSTSKLQSQLLITNKTIIRLGPGEYCRIIPSTSSRGLFAKTREVRSARQLFYLAHYAVLQCRCSCESAVGRCSIPWV